MITFRNDEAGYFEWVKRNRSGFIINVDRNPRPSYVKLHSATCGTVTDRSRGPYTTHDYIKVCSLDRGELIDWAREDVGGEPGTGCHCLNY